MQNKQWWRAGLSMWLALGLLLLSSLAMAQGTGDFSTSLRAAEQRLDAVSQQVQRIQSSLEDAKSADTLSALAEDALRAQREATAVAQDLMPTLGQLDARIAQLGQVSEGSSEDRDIGALRQTLGTLRKSVDGAIKQGNLEALEAAQLGERIEALRVRQFNDHLFERGTSPLSLGFWRELFRVLPEDLQRLGGLISHGYAALIQATQSDGVKRLLLGSTLALLLVIPVRQWLRRVGRRVLASPSAPHGRLRRSGLAIWLLVVSTVLPTLAAAVWVDGLRAMNAVAPRLELVASQLVVATGVGAFLASLSSSVLMPHQSSWRLFDLSDAVAVRLRKYAWLAALVVFVSVMMGAVNTAARISAVSAAALDGVLALCYMLLIALAMRTLAPSKPVAKAHELATDAKGQTAPHANEDESLRGGWALVAWVGGNLSLIAAAVGAVLGFLNFSVFISSQMVWMTAVVLAAIILFKFVDDLVMWLFSVRSRSGRALQHVLGLRAARLEQLGVLLSALLRVGVVMLALTAVLAPFGNSRVLYSWLDVAGSGITVGGAIISPWAVVRAALILSLGLGLFNIFQSWLAKTYLPTTELDIGARNSIRTVARYTGLVVSFLWALAALGIGLEKVALLASALSVGIGFGLQAITQNFFSGLILLAERPVKLGDRVRIGDQEGEVRRISVRATEIQVDDKSTLIVPNSELITKQVRNMTMGSPLGRLQLRFGVPLDTDVVALRALMQQVYAEHEAVLDEPAPNVFIDGIEGGMIIINSNAHVSSPGAAYRTRSEVLFALLPKLAEADIPLMTAAEISVKQAGAVQLAATQANAEVEGKASDASG